jgi:F-type H+-transporting ATPase subunit b
MEILKQLGDLFLAAIPTAVIVFFFYLFLRWSFFGPIEHVVAERSRGIEGARREAEGLHKEALRNARADIFREQEGIRRAALDERGKAILQARQLATEEIQEAKSRIRAEIDAARTELELSSTQLAEEIARTILEPQRPMHPRPAGEV